MWNALLGLVVLGILVWGGSLLVGRLTVYEYQHALKYRKGCFEKLLEPGIYWFSRLGSRIDIIDSRPRVLTIPGQEILSADGVTLKVSLSLQYQVDDPEIAALAFENYEESLYADIQIRLREAISETPIAQLLERRKELDESLQADVVEMSQRLGVRTISLAIKDIMFPGALKEVFSQVARAKQEGLASLEKARAETASLRKLANTAKLLNGNPNLYRLRLLQTIDDSGTVVLRLDSEADIELSPEKASS